MTTAIVRSNPQLRKVSKELGRWEFEDFDPRTCDEEAVKVISSSGPYAEGFDEVKTFRDFLLKAVGTGGMRTYKLEGTIVDRQTQSSKRLDLMLANARANLSEKYVQKEEVTLNATGTICKADESAQP